MRQGEFQERMAQIPFKVKVSRACTVGDQTAATCTHRFSLPIEQLGSLVSLLEASGVQERGDRLETDSVSIRYIDEEGDEICIVNDVQWQEYTLNSPVGPQLLATPIVPRLQRLHIQLSRSRRVDVNESSAPAYLAGPETVVEPPLSRKPASQSPPSQVDLSTPSLNEVDAAAPSTPSTTTESSGPIDDVGNDVSAVPHVEATLAPVETPRADLFAADGRSNALGDAQQQSVVATQRSSWDDDWEDIDSNGSRVVSITGRGAPIPVVATHMTRSTLPERHYEDVPTVPTSPTASNRFRNTTSNPCRVAPTEMVPRNPFHNDRPNPFEAQLLVFDAGRPRQPSAAPTIASRYIVYGTPTGKKFHSNYCSHSGKGPYTKLTVLEAQRIGLTSCRMCGGVPFLDSSES